MSNEVLIDLLERAETTIEKADQRGVTITTQASQLFSRIEKRLNEPAPAPDTGELNKIGRHTFREIERVADQIEANLASLRPTERISRLKHWRTGAIAGIALTSLLSAFVGGLATSSSLLLTSRADLILPRTEKTCERLRASIQQDQNSKRPFCVFWIEGSPNYPLKSP